MDPLYTEDELDFKIRMGRFSDWEERYWASVLRLATRGDKYASRKVARMRQVVSWRARTVGDGWRFSTGPQVIVKVAGRSKTLQGAINMARYIGQERSIGSEGKVEKPVFYDGLGRPVGSDVVDVIANDWQVLNDDDNLSKEARDLLKDANFCRIESLPINQKLHNIQAWHFVFSVKNDDEIDDCIDRLQRAVNVTVSKCFGLEGHQVLWALHNNKKDHPHVHVIVKAQSDIGHRIRCDKAGNYLHWLRIEFARALSATGLSYDASRRIDHYKTRQAITLGDEPLKKNKPTFHCSGFQGQSQSRIERVTKALAETAQMNGEVWSLDAEQRTNFGAAADLLKIAPIGSQKFREGEALLRSWFGNTFAKPEKAYKRWLFLVGHGGGAKRGSPLDSPLFQLMNRPYLFGKPKDRRQLRPRKKGQDQLTAAVGTINREFDRLARLTTLLLQQDALAEAVLRKKELLPRRRIQQDMGRLHERWLDALKRLQTRKDKEKPASQQSQQITGKTIENTSAKPPTKGDIRPIKRKRRSRGRSL